jgi:DNA-binding GntR family transcriptional regulator
VAVTVRQKIIRVLHLSGTWLSVEQLANHYLFFANSTESIRKALRLMYREGMLLREGAGKANDPYLYSLKEVGNEGN